MELLNDIRIIKDIIEKNTFCLLYIQAPDCGLCSVMHNKIERVAGKFMNLLSIRVELNEVPEIAGAFLVATAPTVLFFVSGREMFRAGNFIDTSELERVISKWIEIPDNQALVL